MDFTEGVELEKALIGQLAQLVERSLHARMVTGSSPVLTTNLDLRVGIITIPNCGDKKRQ